MPRTGEVAILDYLTVVDCGRIINPMTVRGQVIGSLVQGLGGAMLENLVYDEEGQLLTGTLADYLLPTASDFPNLRAIVTDDFPSPINPLGAKGAGEGGIIAAGGIMANAVANALSSVRRRAARAAADAGKDLGDGRGRAEVRFPCRHSGARASANPRRHIGSAQHRIRPLRRPLLDSGFTAARCPRMTGGV